MDKFTDFGFKKVKVGEKSSLVKGVFDSVASKYDIMNDLMSAGMHRLWKNQMVDEVNVKRGKDYKFLDVAGGTGDVAFKIARKCHDLGIKSEIQVGDINQEMLDYGQKRAIDDNLFKDIEFININGEKLPHKASEFDYYTIAFGIRNFTHIDKGLKEAYRVLKKGGKFICLEFSKVNNDILSKLYDLYSFNVIPKVGKMITGDEDSYQYLVESIKKFPDQETFKSMIEKAGFENVSYKSLSFGSVAIHVGYKK